MRVKASLASLAVAAAAALAPPAARAQYFGQNQVQYRDFDFKVLKTAHYDIYYYPEEREQAEVAARLAERWYDRLSKLFEHTLKGRQAIMLYASPADFRQSNVVQGVGEGTGGVTEGLLRRVVLPSAGPVAETDHVLGHELVHAFQYSMSSRGQGGMPSSSFLRLPLWFVEGLAEYLSLGPVDSQTAMWLRDAVASNKLPTLKDLGNPRYFPYRFGHAFWAYVGGRWGDDKVVDLFRDGLRSGDPQMSIKKVLEQDEKTFSKEWGEAVHRAYAGFLEAQRDPQYYGPEIVSKKRGGGELNLGPALSPNGKQIVFLSERDLFSIDLFLADADTGKVIRKLASTRDGRALRQPAVHRLGRRLEQGRQALRPERAAQGQGRSLHRRARDGPQGARGRVQGDLAGGQPHLHARREDRLLGLAGRAHRPVGVRPALEGAEAADARRVRRGAPGGVARRQDDRLHHRSLHDEARQPRLRLLPHRTPRPRDRRRPGGARLPEGARRQPAVVAGRTHALLPLGRQRRDRRPPRRPRHRRAAAGDAAAHRRHGDHARSAPR